MQPEDYFKMAFARVMGNQKEQKIPSFSNSGGSLSITGGPTKTQYFLEFIKSYVNKLPAPSSVLSNEQKSVRKLQQKLQCLGKSSKIRIMESGCAIILEKADAHSFTYIYLVSCTSWDVEYSVGGECGKLYAVPGTNFNVVCIGQLPRTDELNIIDKQYYDCYQKINKISEKLAHNSSFALPSLMVAKCRQALQLLIQKDQHYEILAQWQNEVRKHESVKGLHRNGLGSHQPDTEWCVCWAILHFYAQNTELVAAMMVDYKAYLLQNYCKGELQKPHTDDQYASYLAQKSSIAAFVNCLQDLRSDFQSLNGCNNYYYDNEKSCKKIRQIAETIHKIDVNCQEIYYRLKEMGKHYPVQEMIINTSYLVPMMSEYKQRESENMVGLSSTFLISSATPIEDLLTKSDDDPTLWVMAAEDIIFTLLFNQLQLKIPFKKLGLELVKVYQPVSSKVQCKLSKLFELYRSKMLSNCHTNAMTLECQAHSHVELMKAALAIIAFEIYKREKTNTIYDVGSYRVPIDYIQLYKQFNSLSYKARRAVQSLFQYCEYHKGKKAFFNQAEGYESYKHYGERVASKSQAIKNEYAKRENGLRLKKDQLREQLKAFHQQLKENEQKLGRIKGQECKCRQEESEQEEEVYVNKFKKVMKVRHIECERCKSMRQQEKIIDKMKGRKQYQIKTQIPKQDGLLHQFFYLLDPHLEGLISLMLMCQHDVNASESRKQNLVLFGRGKLQICSAYNNPGQFRLVEKVEADVDNLVKYAQNEVDVQWNGKSQPSVKYHLMSDHQNIKSKELYNKYMEFFANPSSPPNNNREHGVYAKMGDKHTKIKMDEFIAVGSTRVGEYTQLPMCLEGLLSRNIMLNTLQTDYEPKLYAVYRSLSSTESTRPVKLSDEANQNIWSASIYFYTYFLNNYHQKWESADYNSLPVVGPLLSLMSRTITDTKHKVNKLGFIFTDDEISTQVTKAKRIIKHVMKKIYAEYERLEEDIRSSPDKQASSIAANRQSQYFICFGGICCFTELLLSMQSNLAVYFIKLIVIMRFKEVYLGANKSNSHYMAIIKKYQMFKIKAIQTNIKMALKFFLANLPSLTKVVEVVDETINQETEWVKDIEGEYLFKGHDKWGNTYKIDIKHGKVIKNGQSISRVPEQYKQSPEYRAIFQSRDFEVYPSPEKNSFITKRNFTELFVGNISQQDSVLVEFGLTSHKPTPTISLIFRYNKSNFEQKWRLVSNQCLVSYLALPKIYTQNYFAWYSARRSCIVFRKPSLDKIGQVALVAYLEENKSWQKKVTHIHVISKQHYRASLDQLCDPSLKIFDRLILRHQKESIVYNILSRVEKVEYILELESYESKKRKFWLHRYDSMFIQDEEHGILPESFKGYRVSDHPFSHPLLPWTEKDRISCLVLEKFIFSEATQQLHRTKILMPGWLCDQTGRITIPDATDINQTSSFYSYDVHDHFWDIRGINRSSQLHMVSILAALNNNLRNSHTKMTSMEYAIKVMKSCYNNCPLTEAETSQVKNIMAIASCQQNQPLILMSYALLKCTMQIGLLKEDSADFSVKFFQQKISNQKFRDLMSKVLSKYYLKLKHDRLPHRQRIDTQILSILGGDCKETSYGRGQLRSWRNQNKLTYCLPAHALQQYIEKYSNLIKYWIHINQEVLKNREAESDSKNLNKKIDFPLNIDNPEDNSLLEELTIDLKNSYQAFKSIKQDFSVVKIDKMSTHTKFTQIHAKLKHNKDEIQKLLNGLVLQNCNHVDIVSGYSPVLSTFDYVHLLTQSNRQFGIEDQEQNKLFDRLFPDFQTPEKRKQFKGQLETLIKFWMIFCVKIDSCERILIILKHEIDQPDQIDLETDKIALFRQCESPRLQIEKRVYWVCFQAEMKIQIWKSQYETFKTLLIKNRSGSISQLNMGQGKTQIIIPMITLDLLYGDELSSYEVFKTDKWDSMTRKIPRVNFMESLLNQSKHNYFRFLSITAFNIPIAIITFDRGVKLKLAENKNALVRSLSYFNKKMLILADQSSTHSLMLKLRQQTIASNGEQAFEKETHIFEGIDIFDIFDEVDAQLTPKKSFIYSIGQSSPFDESEFRTSISAALLETICMILKKGQLTSSNYFVFDENLDDVRAELSNGQFPRGLRLISETLSTRENKLKFRRYLLTNFLQNVKESDEYRFLQILTKDQLEAVLAYLINESQDQSKLSRQITETARKILYAFRGLLAYGILEHCLSQRCNVNYGIPDKDRKKNKRLAVPYEAADIPSKKNDYAHPDVAITLSYLAYYNFGLTEQEVVECLDKLFKMTAGNEQARNSIFSQWFESLSEKEQIDLKITNTLEIQLHSTSQVERLCWAFKRNRRFITYWLKNCVFLKDMTQFKSSITTSSWDHINVKSCIGFSGTKDNRRLLPSYVSLIRSDSIDIVGTDGKMLDLFIENVLEVSNVQSGKQSLWQRFLKTVFSLPPSYKVSSIIDAGAILASKPLKDHIVPWISQNPKFNANRKFKGISFCSDNTWRVYKLTTQQQIDRGTSVPDNETFVIFDEYRTRGADIKMDADIAAVLTLSSTITKDSLMQAIGRLRKLGRNQKVVILMTQQVCTLIKRNHPYKDNLSTQEKVKIILCWSCQNSVNQNEKYFLPNAKLAEIHFANVNNPKSPHIDQSDTSLKTMYSDPVLYKTIFDLCSEITQRISLYKLKQNEIGAIQKLKEIFTLYGQKRKVKLQNFQQVCQRQTEIQTETHQEIQTQIGILQAKYQNDELVQQKADRYHSFKFSSKLKISKNFAQCTAPFYYNPSAQNQNQLMHSFFVLISSTHICMITQREVYRLLISENLPIYQTDFEQNSPQFIARFSDLSIHSQFIKKHKLQEAYVHCKFYNGSSKFQLKEEQKFLKLLLRSEPKKDQKIKYFLERRRQEYKFKNSSLQKIYKDLLLMPEIFSQNGSNNALESLKNDKINFSEQKQSKENLSERNKIAQGQVQNQEQVQQKEQDEEQEQEQEYEQDQEQEEEQEQEQDEEQEQEQEQEQDEGEDEGSHDGQDELSQVQQTTTRQKIQNSTFETKKEARQEKINAQGLKKD